MPSSKINKKFMYEPQMFSIKHIKKWEEQTQTKWYDLSPQSRKKANSDIQRLIDQKMI